VARTPSASAHEKVLEAAIQLIGERGIEGTSMDAIAQLSGVSKATVYKHWKDKETLCIDVIGKLRELPPDFDSGDSRRDLIGFLKHLSKAAKPDRLMKIWPRIIGYAIANPKFGQALQEHSFGPRRVQIARILGEAAERGEVPAGMDANFAMDLLVGPIMHRKFTSGDVPGDLPAQVVDAFLRSSHATRCK
jgi:AcrR family transcriptional regulator